LVRSRTFRRRFTPERFTPAGILASINTILYARQLEEYYCTLCYAAFDLKRRSVVLANSGLPYPFHFREPPGKLSDPTDAKATPVQIEIGGVPLGALPGSTYDEITLDLRAGDLFVLCSDGVFEAHDEEGQEFGSDRLRDVIAAASQKSAREVVDDVFAAVQTFRGETSANDDMTAVAIRITA
jgi:sigma-B regulation protein RsbU (phosphoserine phosphatase)